MATDPDPRLLRLIASEQYAEFEADLPEYLRSINLQDPDSVRQVIEFLNSALLDAKNRRAHHQTELETLQATRVFFQSSAAPPSVDVIG